jgi:K+-sensing histidine kinase KdpD
MLVNQRYISVKFSEEELRERNKALAILLDISNFLSGSLRLGEVLDGALYKVMEHFGLHAGRVYLMDESGQSLTLAAHRGIEVSGLERVRINEGFTGKAAHSRSFILQHVSQLENQERRDLLLSKGLQIVVCVPLIAMDRVIGVINLAAKDVVEFDQEKIDLFGAIGNLIAVAAHNAKLYEDLEKKIREIQEKGETIKFFTYSALHDLKSPVIGIHGLTRLLHSQYRSALDDKGRHYCDQILKSAAQVELLVERINTYIMAKEAPLNIETFQVKEIIEMIRAEFSAALTQRGVTWVEPASLPEIRADRLSLTRVFRNLVDNALKYGGKGLSEIRIGYRSDGNFHIFSVSDDGVGVKNEHCEKIFQVFERHETSKGTEGSGLGLAITRVIAERHGGKVRMEPGAEKGVTFHIYLAKNL